MKTNHNLIMIGAMYENGGNTLHRFLDGHPQMFVYPFESQLGTKFVNDQFTSLFPVKYRWPAFNLDSSPDQDYMAIIDEECKVRARTPHVSKFRHVLFDFNDDERKKLFVKSISKSKRSRSDNVLKFFKATFQAWKNYRLSGKERVYVGYSPIITIDADKILEDLPRSHFIHVVRNPWSAYADTKKRPVPLSLQNYLFGWSCNQYFALLFKRKYPKRFHIIRTEDVLNNPYKVLSKLCHKLGLKPSASLNKPTWNGIQLREVYPWGTIRKATTKANRQTAMELSVKERNEIRERAAPFLKDLNYTNFLR